MCTERGHRSFSAQAQAQEKAEREATYIQSFKGTRVC